MMKIWTDENYDPMDELQELIQRQLETQGSSQSDAYLMELERRVTNSAKERPEEFKSAMDQLFGLPGDSVVEEPLQSKVER